MKLNDWIVASINNPNLSIYDFKSAGLNLNNTQLRPKEEYEKSPYILEAFLKDGAFDKAKFEDFYNELALKFGEFLEDDTSNSYMYDLFNTSRVPGDQVRNPNFKLYTVANPTRQSFGVTGRNELGTLTLSISELALTLKIYDPSKNTWSDKTINELALFKNPVEWVKSLFLDPVVLAKYDSDGTHVDLFTGETVQHRKGDYKTNKEGTYYAEKLNGRSLIGLEVISAFDTLTVDGDTLNKYDFFDSDGLDKDVKGTIAKSAVAVLPLLIGGPVADIYAGAMVAKETLKTLPMLYNLVGAWVNAGDSKLMNTLAGIGTKFSSGLSKHAQENLITVEGLSNLMTDVALLWGLQKAIAKAVSKLLSGLKKLNEAYSSAYMTYLLNKALQEAQLANKTITLEYFNKLVGTADKWEDSALGRAAIKKFVEPVQEMVLKLHSLGADLSLAYMALVSNTDVYDSMIEHGASKKEAAAVALGSILGMFSVDKYAHLGELFFDDLTAESERAMRATFRKEAGKWGTKFLEDAFQATAPESKELALKALFNKGVLFGKNTLNGFWDDLQFHSTKFLGKALGEGLEEVSEELVTDISKSMYELAGDFGLPTTVKDVGAWDNAMARYGMSFLGGAMGGGLFAGIDIWNNGFRSNDIKDDLTYLIRNNKISDIYNSLDKFKQEGKLGSTKLSTNTTEVTDSDGNTKKVFMSAKNGEETQNDFVYRHIKDTVQLLDAIINGNLLGLSDEEVFLQMVLGDVRFLELDNLLKGELHNLSYTEKYQELFHTLVKDFVLVEKDLEAASATVTGNPTDPKATDELLRHMTDALKRLKELNIAKLEAKKAELELERDDFLLGKKSFPFIEKMLFAINSEISGDFYYVNFEEYCKKEYNRLPSELNESEYNTAVAKYRNYKKNNQPSDLDTKFKLFKTGLKATEKWFKEMLQNQEEFKKSPSLQFELDKLFKDFRQYDWDSVLDFNLETKDSIEYTSRNNLLDTEASEDEFILRKANRNALINLENIRQVNDLKSKILELIDSKGGYIDSSVLRFFTRRLGMREKDIRKDLLSNLELNWARLNLGLYLDNTYTPVLRILMESLPDLKKSILERLKGVNEDNYSEVIDEISNSIISSVNGSLSYDPIFRAEDDDAILGEELTSANIDNLKLEILDKANSLGIVLDEEDVLDEIFSYGVLNNLGNITIDDIGIDPSGVITIPTNGEPDTSVENGMLTLLPLLKLKYKKGQLDDYLETSSNFHDDPEITESDLGEFIGAIKDFTRSYVDSVAKNPYLNLIKEVSEKVQDVDTPVKNLLKSLAITFGKNPQSIESILQKLYERFSEYESAEDFVLEESERQAFEEFSDILKFANALITASTDSATNIDLFGYSKSLNLIAKDHKVENYEDLAELSLDVANALRRDLALISLEIGELDKDGNYTPLSWSWLATENEKNKARVFQLAELKWNQCLIDFLNNSDALRHIKIDDLEFDLLKGIELIDTAPKATNINKLFDLVYDNFLNLIKTSGLTISEIFEKTKLLDSFLIPGEHIVQSTKSLDQNIEYKHLNFYDKLLIFLTMVGVKSSDFAYFMSKRVEDENEIAPLTIQSWVTRLAIASIESQETIKAAYEYVNVMLERLNLPILYKLPIITNSCIVLGNGGAGKSRVIAKNITEWQCKDLEKSNLAEKTKRIWLSSFKLNLVDNLKSSVSYGLTMLLFGEDSLMSKITDINQVNEMIEDLKHDKTNSKYYTVLNTGEAKNMTVKVDLTKFTFNTLKAEEKPKEIVIDECTHVPQAVILVLAEFCRLNGVHLTLLGDRKQNGFFSTLDLSILKESCFGFRTLELGLSLRDSNILHTYNINILGKLLSLYMDSEAGSSDEITGELFLQKLKLIQFKVYKLVLNGDLITTLLTSEMINSIPNLILDLRTKVMRLTTIGYIGKASDSYVKLLLDRGLEVNILTEGEILGAEFDYCIFNGVLASTPLELGKLLYTAITRGREGSIIVTPDTSVLGSNKIDSYQAKASTIQSAVYKFRDAVKGEYEEMIKDYTPTYLATPNLLAQLVLLPQLTPLPLLGLLTPNQNVLTSIDITKDGEYLLPEKYNYNDAPRFISIVTNPDGSKTFLFGTKVNNTFTYCDSFSGIEIDSELVSGVKNPRVTKLIYTPKSPLKVIGYYNGGNALNIDINENPFEDLFELDLTTLLKKNYVTPLTIVNEYEAEPELSKKSKKGLDDLLLEDVNEVNHSLEMPTELTSFPIMVHSSASFLSLDTLDEYAWKPMEGDIKRNANIFLSDLLEDGKILLTRELIANGTISNQRILQKRLLSFKRKFTYNTSWEKVPLYFKDIIDESTYTDLQNGKSTDTAGYKIVIRKSDDLFVRGTGYSKVNPIAGDYIVEYVMYFTNRAGEKCEVTMGLLGDPKVFIANLDKIKTNYKNDITKLEKRRDGVGLYLSGLKKIDYINAINLQIDKIKDLILHYDPKNPENYPTLYNNWIDSLKAKADLFYEAKDNGESVESEFFEVTDIPKIKWTYLSRIRNKSGLNKLDAVRVISYKRAKIKSLEQELSDLQKLVAEKPYLKNQITYIDKEIARLTLEIIDLKDPSFASRNVYTVWSGPYVVTDASVLGLDDSVVGKHAVLFASNDDTLSPEELVTTYIELKNILKDMISSTGYYDPYASTDVNSVRMIVLNNGGILLSELVDRSLKDFLMSKQSIQGLTIINFAPWNTAYTGERMFVAMWNYRANLLRFLEELNTWLLNNPGLSLDKLEAFDKVRNKSINNSASLTTLEQLLMQDPEYSTYIEAIDAFNSSLASLCKEFRLGYAYKEDQLGRTNGLYISEIKHFSDAFYDKSKGRVLGIYIEPSMVEKQLHMLNLVFTYIIDPIVTCKIDPKELVTHHKGYPNSILLESVIESKIDGKSVFKDTDSDGVQTLHSLNPDYNDGTSVLNIIGPTHELRNSKGELLSVLNAFSNLPVTLIKFILQSKAFKLADQESWDYLCNSHNNLEITNFDENGKEILPIEIDRITCLINIFTGTHGTWDESLEQLFNLIFHGTVEDITTTNTKDSCAMFPNGFYIDPLTSTDNQTKELKDVGLRLVDTRLYFFETDACLDDPVGFIGLEEIQSVIQSLNNNLKEEEQVDPLQETTINCNNQSLQNLILEIINDPNITTLTDRETEIMSSLEVYVRDLDAILKVGNEITDLIIDYSIENANVTVTTWKDKLNEALITKFSSVDTSNITYIVSDDLSIIVTAGEENFGLSLKNGIIVNVYKVADGDKNLENSEDVEYISKEFNSFYKTINNPAYKKQLKEYLAENGGLGQFGDTATKIIKAIEKFNALIQDSTQIGKEYEKQKKLNATECLSEISTEFLLAKDGFKVDDLSDEVDAMLNKISNSNCKFFK